MTKTEFIAIIAEKTGLTKTDADKAIGAFLETVTETLKQGNKVTFAGFGTFEISQRVARTGRNPQTGATIEIKVATTPKFKPGKGLKDAVA